MSVTNACEDYIYYGRRVSGSIPELPNPNLRCKMLKRFVIFTGEKDQCQSGWNSLDSDHDTLEEALARGCELTRHRIEWDDPNYDGEYDENDYDPDFDETLWVQIVDTDSREVVKEMGYEVP